MQIKKFKSSKELKESMQNVDRVIENELKMEPVVAIEPVLADAYRENKEIELHVEKVLDELSDKAEDIVEIDSYNELKQIDSLYAD